MFSKEFISALDIVSGLTNSLSLSNGKSITAGTDSRDCIIVINDALSPISCGIHNLSEFLKIIKSMSKEYTYTFDGTIIKFKEKRNTINFHTSDTSTIKRPVDIEKITFSAPNSTFKLTSDTIKEITRLSKLSKNDIIKFDFDSGFLKITLTQGNGVNNDITIELNEYEGKKGVKGAYTLKYFLSILVDDYTVIMDHSGLMKLESSVLKIVFASLV